MLLDSEENGEEAKLLVSVVDSGTDQGELLNRV